LKGKIAAWIMAGLLLVYIVLVGQRAVLLLASGSPIAIVLGAALIVVPLVGVWALARELAFGFQTEKLVGILAREGKLPVDDLPHRPSGRPLRDAADAEFDGYRQEVEAAPESWRAWFRLGLAYDASGDRRRARQALRQAIAFHRTAP
jgi:hypothetical protein